jgi:uncharacterized delta-60 repeat protein
MTIVRLNPDGTLDESFNPSTANHVPLFLTIQVDGKIVVGGWFTEMGGQTRNHIARLHPDGTLDKTFNPGANSRVYALAIKADSRIVVGGSFTRINNQERNYFALLEQDGALDENFHPQADNQVRSLAIQTDGKILVGGGFTEMGGETRKGIARLNADGSLQIIIDPPEAAEAGAQWRIKGTSTWYYSGETVTNILVGTYTIEFKVAPGWRPQGTITVTVEADKTTTLTGSYFEQAIAQPGVLMLLLDDEK